MPGRVLTFRPSASPHWLTLYWIISATRPKAPSIVMLIDIGRTLGGYLHLLGWSDEEAVEQLVGALPATVEDWNAARTTACRWLPEPASKRREIFDGLKRRPV